LGTIIDGLRRKEAESVLDVGKSLVWGANEVCAIDVSLNDRALTLPIRTSKLFSRANQFILASINLPIHSILPSSP